jgi:hypothetical protein
MRPLKEVIDMMQTIDGKRVYVVEFDTMPEMPITGLTEEEAQEDKYERFLDYFRLSPINFALRCVRKQGDYAWALTEAIKTGVITEPGKYGIHIDTKANRWEVFKIIEE